MITEAQNKDLQVMPNLEEVRKVVFTMNTNSVAGPDWVNGKIFQVCWDNIKNDLLAVIQAFFCGQDIPKYFSYTCLVLLPKINHINKLS